MRISRFLLPVLLGCTALSAISSTRPAQAQLVIGASITIAPPELPIYVQPPMPGVGYI